MNPRFVALTFGACTIVFAGVWAITAPAGAPAPAIAAAEPAMLYADCDAVRAAGAAPLRASQPGYRPALDPNMNGIACETVGAVDPAPLPSETVTAQPSAQPVPVPVPVPVPDPSPPVSDPGPPPEDLPPLT